MFSFFSETYIWIGIVWCQAKTTKFVAPNFDQGRDKQDTYIASCPWILGLLDPVCVFWVWFTERERLKEQYYLIITLLVHNLSYQFQLKGDFIWRTTSRKISTMSRCIICVIFNGRATIKDRIKITEMIWRNSFLNYRFDQYFLLELPCLSSIWSGKFILIGRKLRLTIALIGNLNFVENDCFRHAAKGKNLKKNISS